MKYTPTSTKGDNAGTEGKEKAEQEVIEIRDNVLIKDEYRENVIMMFFLSYIVIIHVYLFTRMHRDINNRLFV